MERFYCIIYRIDKIAQIFIMAIRGFDVIKSASEFKTAKAPV